MASKDYYNILGLEKGASKDDINNIFNILGISFELNVCVGGIN